MSAIESALRGRQAELESGRAKQRDEFGIVESAKQLRMMQERQDQIKEQQEIANAQGRLNALNTQLDDISWHRDTDDATKAETLGVINHNRRITGLPDLDALPDRVGERFSIDLRQGFIDAREGKQTPLMWATGMMKNYGHLLPTMFVDQYNTWVAQQKQEAIDQMPAPGGDPGVRETAKETQSGPLIEAPSPMSNISGIINFTDPAATQPASEQPVPGGGEQVALTAPSDGPSRQPEYAPRSQPSPARIPGQASFRFEDFLASMVAEHYEPPMGREQKMALRSRLILDAQTTQAANPDVDPAKWVSTWERINELSRETDLPEFDIKEAVRFGTNRTAAGKDARETDLLNKTAVVREMIKEVYQSAPPNVDFVTRPLRLKLLNMEREMNKLPAVTMEEFESNPQFAGYGRYASMDDATRNKIDMQRAADKADAAHKARQDYFENVKLGIYVADAKSQIAHRTFMEGHTRWLEQNGGDGKAGNQDPYGRHPDAIKFQLQADEVEKFGPFFNSAALLHAPKSVRKAWNEMANGGLISYDSASRVWKVDPKAQKRFDQISKREAKIHAPGAAGTKQQTEDWDSVIRDASKQGWDRAKIIKRMQQMGWTKDGAQKRIDRVLGKGKKT